jgi:predicted alpha/beta-hydrolase family hydrolase
MTPTRLSISVNDALQVSALLLHPPDARSCFVFAHGAGAGMTHPFMTRVADALAARSIATLRFNFPYLERGSRRPDPPALCHTTVRAAVATASALQPHLRLVAGGKSFGGRMVSQSQAAAPLPAVRGLAFFGFPLHPAGKVGTARADHLGHVHVPMLFLQGTNDALADLPSLKSVTAALGRRATLFLADGADHSFHVPARSGRDDTEVLNSILDEFATWLGALD